MNTTETYIIIDPELGYIQVKTNAQARRLIFRCRDGALLCTTPPYCSEDKVRRAVESMRTQLHDMISQHRDREEHSLCTPQSRIQVDDFTFHCEQSTKERPWVREDAQGLTLYYPEHTDWSSSHLQSWITRTIEECLRRRAQWVLLPRLAMLAEQRGLHVHKASIHKTKSRWGSCSGQGHIHLSLYLMLLPSHLRDYIMHHELTHLQEMNHGPRFHALLNQAVGGREEALSREMKQYRTALTLQ